MSELVNLMKQTFRWLKWLLWWSQHQSILLMKALSLYTSVEDRFWLRSMNLAGTLWSPFWRSLNRFRWRCRLTKSMMFHVGQLAELWSTLDRLKLSTGLRRTLLWRLYVTTLLSMTRHGSMIKYSKFSKFLILNLVMKSTSSAADTPCKKFTLISSTP